ncbi:hypothetical protein, partial [Mycolicibacterium iranicum]|uniref:hypothetical protein n=1 Tax=Mycolicibacterium iranicum TaxID=912594 RepID=UPI001F183825
HRIREVRGGNRRHGGVPLCASDLGVGRRIPATRLGRWWGTAGLLESPPRRPRFVGGRVDFAPWRDKGILGGAHSVDSFVVATLRQTFCDLASD